MIDFLKNHVNHNLLILIAEFGIGFIYFGGFLIICDLGMRITNILDEREKINEV